MLTPDIKKYINQSVLCWLATASAQGEPSVSPKEIFTLSADDQLLIANIASPKSVQNILANPSVCVSFIDILVQKGYQLYGHASVITPDHPQFEALAAPLKLMAGQLFPIKSVIVVDVQNALPIIAPKYRLYPDTKETDQIESALKTYKIKV